MMGLAKVLKLNPTIMPIKMKQLLLLVILLLGQNQQLFAQDDYFKPLSQRQIDKNNAAINKNGVISEISEVPNTRVSANLSVSDPHSILTQNAKNIIEKTLDNLQAEKDYEVMVVCLNSIDGQDPRFWGTDLFNLWQIGDRETENGLLILLVMDARRVEFISGRGLEAVLTDAEGYDIQQEYMVPFFKKSDYVTGMVRGVQAVSNLLMGKEVLYDSNTADTGYDTDATTIYYDYNPPPDPFYQHPIFIAFAVISGFLTVLFFIFLIFAYSTKNLYRRYKIMRVWSLLVFAFIAPIPFIALVIYTRKALNRWRNMERVGIQSGDLLHKMNEDEDDEYLTKGQIAEEVIKSIDYDVWVNEAGTEVQILAYKKWFSPYRKCSKCGYRTWIKVYDKIVYAATYSRAGKGERKHQCKNCGHQTVKRYTIPRKQRSSSGGGYYSSGGSSSGGGSFGGGGGGFSGGSFGGGSSGAGGAGSSW